MPAQRPTKVKKQTTKAKSKAIKEESSSESDYSDSSDNEEPEPSPLPAVRPSDIEGGTKYDALKIVWSPRNKHPSADSIRKSMVAFGELVKRIRDTWKSHSEALKKAENQNEEQKVPTLKTQVLFQRHILDAVVKTAIDSGHPAFVHRYVYSFCHLPLSLSAVETRCKLKIRYVINALHTGVRGIPRAEAPSTV